MKEFFLDAIKQPVVDKMLTQKAFRITESLPVCLAILHLYSDINHNHLSMAFVPNRTFFIEVLKFNILIF